jgi:hypothetical protein
MGAGDQQGGRVSELVALVVRARRGDADAFGALIEARQEAMNRVATVAPTTR